MKDNLDELIEDRRLARINKNWKLSDEIRDYLDAKMVFVFDASFGQEVYFLSEKYFSGKYKSPETASMTKRQYVEFLIKQEINSNKVFDAWVYSMNNLKSKS